MAKNGKSTPKKSFIDVYREVNEREHAEALKRESDLEEEKTERERRARESYEAKLRQEKLELLKLKQGVISEEDIPREETVEKHYTIWQKIGNYFYHNKPYIIFGTLIAALAIFLIYDLVTTVHPDAVVMIIAEDDRFDYAAETASQLLERYCADYNGDGKVSVRVSYLPVYREGDPNTMYYREADSTKLMAEFQGTEAIMVLGSRESCQILGIENGVLADLREFFPGDENVSELGYMLRGTSFAEDIGCENLADDLFMGFRQPKKGSIITSEKDFQNNFNNAVELWTNYINGNLINETETE